MRDGVVVNFAEAVAAVKQLKFAATAALLRDFRSRNRFPSGRTVGRGKSLSLRP